MKISYLGPKGTFSYEACCKYGNSSYEMVECKTIPDTIMMLVNNQVDKAIVPIENSLQGGVTDTIDTLIENDGVYVVEELDLEIKQNFMAKKKYPFEKLEKVYSHPQAISQCKKFLMENHLFDKVVTVESTAYAAKKVSESNELAACIGNISCLEEYHLELLVEGIQENKSNKTKFWILSKKKNTAKKTKMSMVFRVKNHPGALYQVLKIFNDYHLNLTKIESRPAKTVLGEYVFLIDVELDNSKEDEVIRQMTDIGIFIRILGKY